MSERPNEEQTVDRKDDHIRIVEEEDVETGGSGFRDVQLIHEALPEMDYADIDTSVEFLGQELAAAAEEMGVAMGVGSQRAALDDPDEDLLAELETAMFVTGSDTVAERQRTEYVVLGRTREFLDQR